MFKLLKTYAYLLLRAIVITMGLGMALLGVMLGWENLQAPGSLNVFILTVSFVSLGCGIILLWVGLWYMREA